MSFFTIDSSYFSTLVTFEEKCTDSPKRWTTELHLVFFVSPRDVVHLELFCAVFATWPISSNYFDANNVCLAYNHREINYFNLESKLLFFGTNSAELFGYKLHYIISIIIRI